MRDLISRRDDPAAWPDGVITRYRTVGGALVDLYSKRFTTRYIRPGCLADAPHEINGWNWACNGCGETGDTGVYREPDYREPGEARGAAQEHAEKCRAIPRP